MSSTQDPPIVLVIDDNPDDLAITTALLRYFGLETVEAADGVAGLGIARGQRVDAAVIDLAMPGISGMDVGAAFRADPRLARVPLIAISAHVEYKHLAKRAGFDAVLPKPLDPQGFITTVRRLLEDRGREAASA